MASYLAEEYKEKVAPALEEKFNYTSSMQIPKIDKIVLNMGVGDAVSNAKNLDEAVEELTLISGQKPLITKAKKSIANSVYVKVCLSVLRLLLEAIECTTSYTS